MKLEDIGEVTSLHSRRTEALKLCEAARSGTLFDLDFCLDGVRHNAFATISTEPIRAAVVVAAEEVVIGIDKRLSELGVRPTNMMVASPATLDDWKRSAEMFSRAWLRELGGRLVPKRHFIDALVITTRHLRERAEAANGDNSRGGKT